MMKRALPVYSTIVLVLITVGRGHQNPFSARAANAADAGRILGLADAFSLTRGVVRDSNGDGLADVIAARILVPARPAAEDVLPAKQKERTPPATR